MEINDILKDKQALKQLIGALQTLVDSDDNQEPLEHTDNVSQENNTNTKKNQKKIFSTKSQNENPSTFVNKFDDMAEKNMHKGDIEIDKLLKKHPKTPRLRKQNKLDVICRVCGKKETIPSSLLVDSKDRYKCNSCSSKAG
jgi:hypothetical protein